MFINMKWVIFTTSLFFIFTYSQTKSLKYSALIGFIAFLPMFLNNVEVMINE